MSPTLTPVRFKFYLIRHGCGKRKIDSNFQLLFSSFSAYTLWLLVWATWVWSHGPTHLRGGRAFYFFFLSFKSLMRVSTRACDVGPIFPTKKKKSWAPWCIKPVTIKLWASAKRNRAWMEISSEFLNPYTDGIESMSKQISIPHYKSKNDPCEIFDFSIKRIRKFPNNWFLHFEKWYIA